MTSCGLDASRPSAARMSLRISVKLAVTMVPGHTLVTRIPSLARLFDRFLVTLDRAAFDAVEAPMRGFCGWMNWAEKVTMRAQSAARSIGNAARIVRTPAMVPNVKAVAHSAS